MIDWESLRLRALPLPLKLVVSATLIVLGIGYLIALVTLYLNYNLTDGDPKLTVNDLKRAFYGSRENTTLAAKIHGGSMEQFLPKAGDKEKILSWIQDGAPREGYEAVVRPILVRYCIRCHNPQGLQRFAPLTTYEEVMVFTEIDRGEPLALWARVAHTHIQSIGLIFFVLGTVFSFSSSFGRWKTSLLAVPFLALLVDFGARFFARHFPDAVYLMLLSGGILGVMFGLMTLAPLYEMWLMRPPKRPA